MYILKVSYYSLADTELSKYGAQDIDSETITNIQQQILHVIIDNIILQYCLQRM